MSSKIELPEWLTQGTWRRIAILGVGNELTGDDIAGVLVARGLKAMLEAQPLPESAPQILVMDAGAAPENFTGKLRRFEPELVLWIDAAELGAAVGTVEWFDWQAAEGLSASTHTMPPFMLAKYLIHELGCRVALVGIQPEQLHFDEPPSQAVMTAVQRLTNTLGNWLNT